MLKQIIFDLNDTLVRGLTGVEEELSLQVDTPKDKILECLRDDKMLGFLLGETSEDEFLGYVIRKNSWGIDLNELKRMVRRNFDYVIDGMDELVKELSSHYDLVLLSDQGKEWAEYVEEHHAFIRLIPHRFYSCDYGIRKTGKEIFELVLKRLGCGNQECLFIDDRERFLKMAEAVGIPSIEFKNVMQLRDELDKHGVLCVKE